MKALDLSNARIELDPNTFISGGSNRTRNAAVFTNLTGFSVGDELDTSGPTANGASSFVFNLPNVAALSSVTAPVEFRVYFQNDTGANSNWQFNGNDTETGSFLSLDDVNVIPEPGAAGLLISLLGVGFLGLRRRRS